MTQTKVELIKETSKDLGVLWGVRKNGLINYFTTYEEANEMYENIDNLVQVEIIKSKTV